MHRTHVKQIWKIWIKYSGMKIKTAILYKRKLQDGDKSSVVYFRALRATRQKSRKSRDKGQMDLQKIRLKSLYLRVRSYIYIFK